MPDKAVVECRLPRGGDSRECGGTPLVNLLEDVTNPIDNVVRNRKWQRGHGVYFSRAITGLSESRLAGMLMRMSTAARENP